MLLRRVIPCLDVDKGRVVKGVEFVNLRDAGDPVELAVRYQEAGAARVVLGTAAYNDPELLDRALEMWGGRVVVAVDVRGGQVSVAGWTKETQTRGEDVIARLQRRGASRFVYTNVDRDGMLEGPDLDEVTRISQAVRGRFIYSGGIGSVEDLRALRARRLVNLAGVISGKALYERRFTVREGQAALEADG